MKVLKNFQYILASLALLFCVNVGYANTTGKEGKTSTQEQEGKRKSSQALMTPDTESATDSAVENIQEEENDSDIEQKTVSTYSHLEKSDSIKEEESVSKYNFIFYFLYKFKYDGQASP